MIKKIVALVQSDVVSTKYHTNQVLSASVCHTTKSISVAHRLIESNHIDLLIIETSEQSDLLYDFVSYVADISYTTKIVIVAEHNSHQLQETYLSSGADLYLSLPFSRRSLELYCNKLLNLNKYRAGTLLHLAEASLQPETAHLCIGSHQQQLRKREAEILAFFFRHKNQIITRGKLIDSIWGFCEELPSFTTVDVYVRRLRMQLRNSGAILQTIRGIGYIAKE
ncbi:MAG: hypothetical protein GW947_02700 [Candidatus Pacebacteria bacterium]|nr:hypothetical protein [Candidatus Paceibacterota bacterium]PIR59806.1 MAG: hypothetical protein COU68_03585 [Candidatus Pacebacteria bacterium CG10_big_fil_rev_8_21_14_0_10_45_6]